MDPGARRRAQLAAGAALFAVAVAVSYFSISEAAPPEAHDVVLLIDTSGSMADGSKLEFAKRAASGLVGELGPGGGTEYRVGLVAFSDGARAVSGLGDGPRAAGRGIASLHADGGTAMGDGLREAARMLAGGAPGAGRSIVLLSDGMATGGLPPLAGAADARAAGARVFAVGYGGDADEGTLRAIASATGGRYFAAADGPDLARAFGEIAELIVSPLSHYSSRAMMLATVPILLFIPAIGAGITTMMSRSDAAPAAGGPPCPRCGQANRAAARYCVGCGRDLAAGAAAGCPGCGRPNREGARFCAGCGGPLGGAV